LLKVVYCFISIKLIDTFFIFQLGFVKYIDLEVQRES